MTQKEVLSARLDKKTSKQLDEFADENSLSRSEAAERLIHQSLRIENGDVEIVPVSPDGSGVRDGVEENRKQIEETGGKVAELTEQVERESRNETLNYLFMFLGLLYIAASLQYDLPSPTIGIGVIALIGIAATNYRSMVNNV